MSEKIGPNYTWKETQWFQTKTFQLGDEPEVIHVIKSGEPDFYLVVHDDAYEMNRGKCEIMTKDEVETKYNIKL